MSKYLRFWRNAEVKDQESTGIMRGLTWYIFLFSLFGMLSSVALFNYLTDPYGRYGTDFFNAHRIDARSYIVRKLRSQIRPPNVLLFGSSRCLPLKPNYSKGLYGINVALYAGAIEDYYCILRYAVEELNFPVRLVVLGLEPDLLVSTHPVDPMLIRNKSLNRYLEENKKSTIQELFKTPAYIDEIASLLSFTTLKDSCRVVFGVLIEYFGVREASAAKDPDEPGSGVGAFLEMILESKDSMAARLRQYENIYYGVVSIDKERLRYLHRFAEYAKQKRISVVAFLPGYSKPFWDEMMHNDAFEKVQKAFGGEMMRLVKNYQWSFIDFRPDQWRGQDLVFFDGVHPTKNTASIIEKAIQDVINNAF